MKTRSSSRLPSPRHSSPLLSSLHTLARAWPLLALAACGGSGSSSSGVSVPGAPTLSAVTARNASASLRFTAPTDTGGATITSYSGSCTASGTSITASGSASPLTVSGLTNGTAYACKVAATNSAGTGAASASLSVTPVASSGSSTTDTSALPLGDSKIVTTAPSSSSSGYLYVCSGVTSSTNPGSTTKGPWFNSDDTTWNLSTKLIYIVQGAVTVTGSFTDSVANSVRSITGNGLPTHTVGYFPITSSTSPLAYVYDQNGNSVEQKTISWTGLPTSPTVNSTPTCMGGGAIGVMLTGARLFAAMDAKGRDARAWEITDACDGHPAPGNSYHYHSLPSCGLAADVSGQHSALVGYVADGFGLYGKLGDNGVEITNDDLDECHGHTDATVPQYHYHATETFPYTVGCYRGTPVTSHQ